MTGTENNARCPRCGAAFRCGAHDATPCACSTVALDAATLDGLGRRYVGCLCLACLTHAAAVAAAADQAQPPRPQP
jgi:hypothetical protein